MLKSLKTRLRALVPPALFLLITWYFAWNALHGARGIEAQSVERAALAKAQDSFALLEASRVKWETMVADLDGKSVARDMLDEQARQVLNLANPSDIVVPLSPLAAKTAPPAASPPAIK